MNGVVYPFASTSDMVGMVDELEFVVIGEDRLEVNANVTIG